MKKNKGFTLIELLVVIAIIGILSSVVLASLNSARAKGANAAVKSGMANMRAQAELYYDSNNQSYLDVCTNSTTGIRAMLDQATSTGGGVGACLDNTAGWAASSPLKVAETGGSFWCVGSSGASKATSTNVVLYTDCQ